MKRYYKVKTVMKFALLILSLLLVHVSLAQAAPSFKAAGTAVDGTGAVTPQWPAHAAGDIALLFVESQSEDAVTLSTPAGFVAVTNSPQATIATGNNGTRLTVFWVRATSASMGNPTIAATADHLVAQIITYQGVINTGNPWDVTGGGKDDVSNTSVIATGVTTTVADTLIVVAVAQGRDANSTSTFADPGTAGGWTNVNLTGITERSDYASNRGNGGGFGIIDGVKATAGATGNTTVTMSNAFRKAFLTIALKPQPSLTPTKLAFSVQPSNTIYNQTISPAVTVQIQDSLGNLVPIATNTVTIAIGTNPAGGTLSGTLTVSAVAGVATFSNLQINTAGNGYTLTASSAGLTGTTSNAFNITTGAYGLTQCAGSRYGSDLGCNANDVSLPTMSIAPTTPMSYCVGGETVVADLDVTILFQNPARYDVGIFIPNDGKDPLLTPTNGGSQSCNVAILPTTSPFMNLDSNGGQDTCGDGQNSISGVLRMTNVSFLCQAATGSSGNLYIPYVVSWDQNSTPPGAVCTSIANPVPGAPSKCNKPDVSVGEGVVSVVVLPSITKTDNKTTLLPNESTTYTVAISNATGVTLTNATFKDIVYTGEPPAVCGAACLSFTPPPTNVTTCSFSGGATCPVSCNPCDVSLMQGAGLIIPTMPDIAAQSITGITKANPAVVTYSGTDTYANGDKIKITGVLGMTEVNDREFTVANVNTAAYTFQLSGINSADYTAYTSLGTIKEISTVTFTIAATVSSNPPAIITNTATVTAGSATASASDTTGGSGSGSGGSRVRVIKWREVFQ